MNPNFSHFYSFSLPYLVLLPCTVFIFLHVFAIGASHPQQRRSSRAAMFLHLCLSQGHSGSRRVVPQRYPFVWNAVCCVREFANSQIAAAKLSFLCRIGWAQPYREGEELGHLGGRQRETLREFNFSSNNKILNKWCRWHKSGWG